MWLKFIAQTVDFLNIMSYDIHGAWDPVTGHNSPLVDNNNDKLSISDAVQTWVDHGVPHSKLIVGLASYGRGFKLSGSSTSVGAPASGPCAAKPYSREAGILTYYEVCNVLESGGTRFYDEKRQSPYAVNKEGTEWYSYDDVQSITAKLDWIRKQGMGGAFFWNLDMDDFKGLCKSSNGKSYPLLSLMSQGAPPGTQTQTTAGGQSQSNTTPKKTTSAGQPTTTTKAYSESTSGSAKCSSAGQMVAIPGDCTKYGQCIAAGADPLIRPCASGLHFNAATKACDWPSNAKCG